MEQHHDSYTACVILAPTNRGALELFPKPLTITCRNGIRYGAALSCGKCGPARVHIRLIRQGISGLQYQEAACTAKRINRVRNTGLGQ